MNSTATLALINLLNLVGALVSAASNGAVFTIGHLQFVLSRSVDGGWQGGRFVQVTNLAMRTTEMVDIDIAMRLVRMAEEAVEIARGRGTLADEFPEHFAKENALLLRDEASRTRRALAAI